MNKQVKQNATRTVSRVKRVAFEAGKAGLKAGAMAAGATAVREIRATATSARRKKAAKNLGKVAMVAAAVVGAGLVIRNRMK